MESKDASAHLQKGKAQASHFVLDGRGNLKGETVINERKSKVLRLAVFAIASAVVITASVMVTVPLLQLMLPLLLELVLLSILLLLL